MRRQRIRPELVKLLRDELRETVIYISVPCRTVIHRRARGRGNVVETPIHPTQCARAGNGKAVSLRPSIGNWRLPYRSHHWIRESRVVWAPLGEDARAEAGRKEEGRRGSFSRL